MFSTDLTVRIDYAYTSPADFVQPTVNDFRAASGPVILTCELVEGATGTVTYQWTSTCGNCFAKNRATQSVIGDFLRVDRDQGTHTCTATDSDGGETGSASFVMRIIGMLVSSLLCSSIITSNGLHSLPLLQVLGCLCLHTMRLPVYPLVACQTMALLLHLVHELRAASRLPSSVVLVQGRIILFVN